MQILHPGVNLLPGANCTRVQIVHMNTALEQSAIIVVISHLNTMKHFVAVESRYSYQLNRTKLCLGVNLTLFLKSVEIPLLSKRFVLMFLVFKEHTRGLLYTHILLLFVLMYTSRYPSKTECFWLLTLKTWMTLGNLFMSLCATQSQQ